jgi:N-acetylneuraminate synthase/N,N'-diacetyllegionaminate synthase
LDRRRFLIAEIGNNHEGNASLALEMVDAAAEAGADAVKVQVITSERLVNISQTQRIAQLNGFRLSPETFRSMAERANSKGVQFMASAFDIDSLDAIFDLVTAVKVASSDIDFVQLLARAAAKGKPMVVSTGTATMDDVSTAVRTIETHLPKGRRLADSLLLMHCITSYPTPADQANLRAIGTLASHFPVTVGYSDHTLGIEAAVAAAALGARAIEKHFTLDKSRKTFRDHALSADPQDLRRLADALHVMDQMLGTGEKNPMPCERDNRVAARRSIVTARALDAGHVLRSDDIDFVRPAGGFAPPEAHRVVGRRTRVALPRHEVLQEAHLE